MELSKHGVTGLALLLVCRFVLVIIKSVCNIKQVFNKCRMSSVLKIWRVERGKDGFYGIVELERKYIGQLYGGDSYVIHYTYLVNKKEHHIVYFWLVRFCHLKPHCLTELNITVEYIVNQSDMGLFNK